MTDLSFDCENNYMNHLSDGSAHDLSISYPRIRHIFPVVPNIFIFFFCRHFDFRLNNTREQTALPLTAARGKTKMAARMAAESSQMEVEDSISRGSIEVCRLMHPDDANIAGNVHGGITLKLIEEGGFIIATRHCNKGRSKDEPVLAALARVERTDFLQPMYIGEVAQVHVELGYASKRSLEVKAGVWAENLVTGSRRLTNRASLWYVPFVMGSDETIIPEVPAIEYSSKDEEERGKERYERQKRARLDKEEHFQEVQVY